MAVLTWTGLRGGISVALALTLPASPWRADLLVVAYAVVRVHDRGAGPDDAAFPARHVRHNTSPGSVAR